MMFEYKPIKSSNLIEAGYDEATKTVRIKFKNGTYEYPNFAPDLWAEWSATFQTDDSSGKFFSSRIRKMPYKKLDD